MNQFWRTSVVTGAVLFLESVGASLIISILSALTNTAGAQLPWWLVFVALIWAYLLSLYIQTIRFSLNLRGVIGLSVSALSLLVLANLSSSIGFFPVVKLINGDIYTAFAIVLTFIFLIALWWRGSALAHDDITLETMRTTFQWGMAVIIGAVIIDALVSFKIVSGFLIIGFFAVGLFGLSLARFSAESTDGQTMSRNWLIPIGTAVGAVLLLALLVSGLGLGGLDDATRAILRFVGQVGEWILKPILLGLGYIAAALVAFGTWLTSILGGGDLSGLTEAQEQMRRFHENLEEQEGGGPPNWVYTLLKWIAFLAGTSVVGWLIFRVFRFRRLLRRSGEVEEVRESLFTWGKANQDLSGWLVDWWNNLVRKATAEEGSVPSPTNPRELYHRFLELAASIGHPRAEAQTPREHQGGLTDFLPDEPVQRIVNRFEGWHYGNGAVGAAEMETLTGDLTTIRQHATRQSTAGEPDSDQSEPKEPS